MVNITVGQTLNIGVAIWDFCGSIYEEIFMSGMVLGVDTIPTVTIRSPECRIISNIGVEFKLVVSGDTACHGCTPDITYLNLGTVYTDSQGVARKSHIISTDDISYYQQAVAAGGNLRILACIVNSQGQSVAHPGECSDYIVIAGAVIPEPTHEIKFQLADNPFIGYIQGGIVDISVRLVSAIQFPDIPVQYIKAEMDTTNKIFKVFVKYTGTEILSPISGLSPETMKLVDNIQSMAIVDSIKAFAARALVIITTIVVAYLVASIILSGGWTIVAVAQAALVGTAIFILGYVVYRIVDDVLQASETIRVLQAKEDAGAVKDATKGELDKKFASVPYSKDSCITLMTGYQAADIKYIETLTKELSQMQLSQTKQTYLGCTNGIINTFKASPGIVADCNTARAAFTPCVNAMAVSSNTEFDTKYTDPNAPKERGCAPDCVLCEPITETCLSGGLGTGIIFIAAAALGLIMLVGTMKSSGGVITVKTER